MPQFSNEAMHKLCKEVTCCILAESPDNCSANQLKKAKTVRLLPGNCFFADGKCSEHQLHRIVQNDESKAIGDIHAAVFTTTNQSHQARLQAALRTFTERAVFYRGEPDPAWVKRNEIIARRTLLRRKDDLDDVDYDRAELPPAVIRFLGFWNFDWTQPIPGHVCAGCCDSKEMALESLYTSAIEVDLLISNDGVLPSEDDWGSCQLAGGLLSFAMLCHDALYQCFEIALPTWASMMPAQVRAVDDVDRMRRKTQKKTWRTRVVLSCKERRHRILLLVWIAAPISAAMSLLQHIDEKGKGLLDVCRPGTRHPFLNTRRLIAKILHEGMDGILACIAAYVDENDVSGLFMQAREMSMNFTGQVFWRFLDLENFPFKFATLVHPLASMREKWDLCVEAASLRPCCRDKHFTGKAQKTFRTPERLMHDAGYLVWAPGIVSEAARSRFEEALGNPARPALRQASPAPDARPLCRSGTQRQAPGLAPAPGSRPDEAFVDVCKLGCVHSGSATCGSSASWLLYDRLQTTRTATWSVRAAWGC